MNNFFSYLRLLLLATSGMLLLCIIFAMNPELADGTLSGKICWFHFTSLLLAGGVLLMEFTTKKSRFIFSLPDALLLLLFGIVLVSYDKDENLQPERFLFIAQLVALWFMLRGALQAHQELRPFFITIIIFTGIVPAIWGISHTINPAPITHPVFRLLETSLKPEPFYGYIAVIFPVCLNTLLRFKNCDKIALWKSRTFLFYFSILGSTLIITTLIFKTDQPVWLAALLSGIWVCWMRLIGWKQTKEAIQKHIQLFAISSIILFVAITAVILVGNIQKAQAGDRRLLIWNITTQAIMEHPVTGIGIGGFPATYAKEQSAYFETDTASSKEKQTATCPQYAYNEYLQIGLELGITGLLFFIFWLAFSHYYGIRHRQIGASGGILALGIFALYSYPLQLPTYWVLLLFLTTICVTNPKHNKQRAQRSIPYISAIAAILTCILFYGQKDTYYTYREWKTLQELYHNQEYEQAASRYAGLFVQLYHRTDFLYEGAECFYKIGQHDIAIKWLDRALKLSAAPELYYAIAKNEKAIKQYQKAESYLLEISRILPEQGYTYFLLAKLYTNPSFLHPDKFHKAAKRFLAFQPSTQNNITKEMKEEILQIIRNWNFGK